MDATGEWTPNAQELQQLLLLLEHSQSSETEVQRQVQQNIDQLSGHERFGCYLAYILSDLSIQQVANRSLAGIILKNNTRHHWARLPGEIKDYIRQKVLGAIGDESPLIRATVGIILTTVVIEEGVQAWQSLLPTLRELLHRHDSVQLQEGSLGAIQKIFEDSGDRLDRTAHIEPMLPHILPFFNSPVAKMRGLAMNSINCILMVHDDPIHEVIDEFLAALFARAHDDDQEVIKQLCRSLTLLLESHLEKMLPYLSSIIDFIIVKTSDSSEQVALEACEFWLALAENHELANQLLRPFLSHLVPVLVSCMKYSQSELIMYKAYDDTDDSMVPDRQEDLKPRHHRAKVTGQTEDEEDDDDDSSTEWSVRKCAAASLDVLSSIFKNEFLPHLLPILKDALVSSQWEVKESAVLALGAVAEGCIEGMTPHLPELVPFLIDLLRDRKALVRSITCWTLSRYCHFVVMSPHEQYFRPLLKELLSRMLDGNKRVQEAACSAFATLEEEAGAELVPYLGDVLQTIVAAFGVYQAKNLLILYDAVSTLADSVGGQLASPEYIEMIMHPVMHKWTALRDDDKELFPLLECVSSVATALGDSFLPYVAPVFTRCTGIITTCLHQSELHATNPNEVEAPDKDFLIVALDLLSGLASSISGIHIEQLVEQSKLVELVFRCSTDQLAEVRQSSFALLGDLIKTCYQHIQQHIHSFLPILGANLDPELVSVCNNSIWALGEMSMKMGEEMRRYAQILAPPLIQVMCRENAQKTLLENTAITLGRLGIHCAEFVAPALRLFIRPACFALRNIRDNADKESAFRGLCLMVHHNPQGISQDFVFFCDAVASWVEPPPDLKQMFSNILWGFHNTLGAPTWQAFTSQFPEPLRVRLYSQYGL